MTNRWWSTMLVLAVCATPALAQTPPAATPRDAKTPVVAGTTEADLQAFAALDFEDQDLLAADFDDGPNEAPMGDDGPRMAGGHDGPGGMHGRRGPDGPMGGHGGRGPMGGPGGMHAHGAMMAERLQLTDAQRERIHGILEAQMRRGIQERADIQIATLDLHKLMRADSPNRSAIDAQVDKLARLRATLAKERIASMLDAHALLTPEQRARLRTLHDGAGMHGMPGMRGGEGDGREQEHGQH